MSYWHFLYIACWREMGMIGRSIQIAIVAIPALVAAAIKISGGEWSRDLWPWWVWGLIALAAGLAALVIGITRRARFLEEARQPKLKVLLGKDRIFRETYFNNGQSTTVVRLGLANDSDDVIRGVTCLFANAVGDNPHDENDIDKRLLFNDTGESISDLNGRDQRYFKVAEIKQLAKGRDETNQILVGPFTDGQTYPLYGEHYIAKFRVGGVGSPASHFNLEMGLDENRDFYLRVPEIDG